MSVKSARDFLSGAWQDETFRSRLMEIGAKDEEAAFNDLIAFATEAGFDFNKEEFRQATLTSNARALTPLSGNPLVRLRNHTRNLRTPDWVVIRADLYNGQEYVKGIQARVSVRQFLLRDVPGGTPIVRALTKSSTECRRILEELEAALDRHDTAKLQKVFSSLARSSDELFATLRLARDLSAELPVLFDIPELNDFFLVAIRVLKNEVTELEGLAANLKQLYTWTLGIRPLLALVQKYHPKEKELLDVVHKSLEMVTEGVGGVVTFLESGDKADLSIALSLLEKGMRTLAPAIAVIRELRDRGCENSLDLPLESTYRMATEWAEGRRHRTDVLAALQTLLQAHAQDMELAHQESFLPLSAHRALFSEIEETHSVMNAMLVSLAREVRPKRFLEDLDAFRRNGVAFDELYRKLRTFEQSKLSGSPNFQKLLDTMKQVYLEKAPDDRLREFLPFLRSSHEDFLRRLEAAWGEDRDLARECLEEHRRAFLELEEYLRDGDRSRILHAYELILPACIDLEELEQAARDDAVDILEGEPVQRQSRALQQVVAIVKAYRSGQLKQDECLSTLSSIIQQAESAHRTLNSQIRPMLLAKSDQEAQMHYEQLSVILEYQLDGLHQLKQILFSGNVDQVDEAVQELAEVDTYLLAFQQDVEKS